MNPLNEEFRIAAPLEEVWPLIRDPEAVASCIPGAAFGAQDAEGNCKGSIAVRFGPTVATFLGETSLRYDDALHTCSIDGRGTDKRGASRATASFLLAASALDTRTTGVRIDGQFNVSGPLETFASAGGIHVARALIGEFSANVARMTTRNAVEPAAADEAATATPAPRRAEASKPLSGGWLTWKILLGWLRFNARTGSRKDL